MGIPSRLGSLNRKLYLAGQSIGDIKLDTRLDIQMLTFLNHKNTVYSMIKEYLKFLETHLLIKRILYS